MDALLSRFRGTLEAAGVPLDDEYVLAETRFRLNSVLETLKGYSGAPEADAPGPDAAPTVGSPQGESARAAHGALQLVRRW
jgi:hypothetical protein